MISKRFPDNLVASTMLNAQLVPGLDNVAQKGPIAAAVQLDQIVDNVTIDLAQAAQTTSHARPSMFASISSFAENVRKALNAVDGSQPPAVYAGLDKLVKQDFAEWQGMVAAVALSHVYSGSGLDISVDPIYLDGRNQVERCVLMEMDKDAAYKRAVTLRDPITGSPMGGYLYYVCQNGTPFALFHPEVGLCAMKQYDASIFDGVLSWHESLEESCHTGWKFIAEPGSAILDDFCLSRIAWWAGQNNLRQYQNFIRSLQMNQMHIPSLSLISPAVLPNAVNIDSVWPGKGTAFGTTMMFCTDIHGVAYALPELFMDTLLLTYVEKQENNMLVYNTSMGEKQIRFRGTPAALEAFAPIPPFRRSFVKLLENCTLEDLVFDAFTVAGKLQNVLVEATIMSPAGESFTISRKYGADAICQGKVPHLMIWPFVEMPKGMNIWNNYHATWYEQAKSVSPLRDSSDRMIRMISGLSYQFADQGITRKVFRPTAQHDAWEVCTSDKPFRYAVLTGKERDDGAAVEMGMIFVPVIPEYDPYSAKSVFFVNAANPVKLAIDFGTTSTVCALRSNLLNQGVETPLPFKDYSRAITAWDDKAKSILDIEHWLGNTTGGSDWKWDKKIFSVAQLFERIGAGGPNRRVVTDAANQEYYADGRMFLVSGAALANYASSAQASHDPLLDQQIMNDMKFNETLDIKNYQAASIYLAGIYSYAVLYLLSERIIPATGYLELRVSYPNEVTLNALKNSWRYAYNIVGRMMTANVTKAIQDLLNGPENHFYSEATATTAYQRRPLSPLNWVQNLVSLDIGGGTTDISITNSLYPGKVKNLSFRYAGREIMVSSLIEVFRRFSTGAVFDLDKSFKALWDDNDLTSAQGIDSLLNQFAELSRRADPNIVPDYLHGLTSNSTVRMNVEMLLSGGMKMDPAADVNPTNLLRQIIALKFIMVLRVAAEAVHQNIDMWIHPTTGVLNLNNDRLEINLSVSGTSAQLLQYVFDCDMNQLNLLQSRVLGFSSAAEKRMGQCQKLLEIIFEDALKEDLKPGQGVDLKIFVDADVKEKREVCYGMLQDNIDIFAREAPGNGQVPDFLNNLTGSACAMPVVSQADKDAQRKKKITQMQKTLNLYPQQSLASYLNGMQDDQGNVVMNGLLRYIRAYEQIFFFNNSRNNRGLGDRINVISDLLNINYYAPYYTKSASAVAQSRAMYMIEDEQQAYKDLLACMYLVDEIIDWEMADFQRQ